MFYVLKQISFCYGHRLLNYQGKCAHPHGHNGLAELQFCSEELDSRGMVLDFDEIKQCAKTFIDEKFDHQMILCEKDPLVPILQKMNEPIYLMKENPTAENIAKHLFEYVKEKGFPIVSVKIWETPNSCAEYKE